MRHIPEEELHAYLDQALSRSQCVEIESHLAQCPSCRVSRDGIAALRDRTTALLATLVPGRAVTPPFELIEARRAAAAARREARVRNAVWAASMLLAVGAGWGLNQLASNRAESELALGPVALDATPPVAPVAAAGSGDSAGPSELVVDTDGPSIGPSMPPDGSVSDPAAAISRTRSPATRPGRPEPEPVSRGALFTVPTRLQTERSDGLLGARFAAPQSLQVSSSGLSDGLALEGVWRTLSWENAQEEAGGSPAHVDGLPVVQVQVQQAPSGKPLMVVAQQLGTGDVIRTIEGPAADVSSLLRRTVTAGRSSPWPTVEPGDGGAVTSSDGSIVTMQGDRILAISAPGMSYDSLAAIARQMNAARAAGR